MVGVAQLVEHLVVAQDAAGSSPVTHPIKSKISGSAGSLFILPSEKLPNSAILLQPIYFFQSYQKHMFVSIFFYSLKEQIIFTG